MERNENAAIFEDTRYLCRTDSGLREAIQEANAKQEVILETDHVDVVGPRYPVPGNIIVTGYRSFEAAK